MESHSGVSAGVFGGLRPSSPGRNGAPDGTATGPSVATSGRGVGLRRRAGAGAGDRTSPEAQRDSDLTGADAALLWAVRRARREAVAAGCRVAVFGDGEIVREEPPRGMDYVFLRTGAPGNATGLHCDFPFFTRATRRVYTVWLPIGPVPVTEGSLMVVEG